MVFHSPSLVGYAVFYKLCSNQSRRNCVFVICIWREAQAPKYARGFQLTNFGRTGCIYKQTVCSIDQLWQNRLYLQTVCSNQSGRNGAFVICMPLGNKVPRDSFHEKLESLASQEFPTYFCQVQIQTKHFNTKCLSKKGYFLYRLIIMRSS